MAARHKYRLACETINKQNKLPCKAKGYYCPTTKTVRCRLHGGFSTGAKTAPGVLKSLRNLKQFKNSNDQQIRTHSRYFQRNTNVVNERKTFDSDMFNERKSES